MKGILITLEKRVQVLSNDYTENYKYIMFGHYDGMYVKDIDYMGEFCPSYVLQQVRAESGKRDKINDGVSDRYTIKAVYPFSEELSKTTKKINYEMWESKETEDEIQKEYPFISCIIVHLSEDCFKQNTPSNILEEITERINTESSIKGVKCAVYFSIGYSDIILLARMVHFNRIDNIIKELNELKIGDSEKWVSDLYTIIGFDKEAFSTPNSIADIYKSLQEEEMTFCVAFKVKAGFSLASFKEELQKGIQNTLEPIKKLCSNFPDILVNNDNFSNCIWKRFGSIDINFHIKIPVTLFPAFYCKECQGVFSHESEFFKKYIRTIQVFILDKTENGKNESLSNVEYYRLENKYAEFLDDFEDKSKKEHLPRRLFESVVQIMKLYRALAEPKHGFEVRIIVDKAIESFMNNMALAIELLSSSRGDSKTNEEEINRGKLIKDIEEAVTKFRSYIVTYLNDLHRSERSFIEGRTMTHPSIGASTKLLFSYNKFINKLADKNKSINEIYSFIVISGDCDQTKMHELFHFLDVWDERYQHLFIVTIPEVSLFDVIGTLLRLSHECFHCLGNRQRKNRTYYAMYAWTTYIAEEVSNKLFDKDIYYLDKLFSSNNDNKDEISNFITGKRNVFCEKVKQHLKEEIKNMYEKNDLGENHKDFYSSRCVKKIKKDLGIYFFFTHEKVLPLIYNDVLNEYLELQQEILKKILEDSGKMSSSKRIIQQMFSEIGYYIHNRNSTDNPEDAIDIMNMENLCTNLFLYYFSSVVVGSKKVIYVNSISDSAKYKNARNDKGKVLFDNKNEEIDEVTCFHLESFPLTIINVICECFSDYQAYYTLKVSFEQFMVALIYETRDVEKAMPLTINNILRIGIDLDILFNISTVKLSDSHKKKIRSIIDKKYYKAGFQIDINIEEYIQRIEEILKEYQNWKFIGNVVKHYLEESKPSDDKNRKFKEFYSSLGEVDILPKIYEFLNVEKKLEEKMKRKL